MSTAILGIISNAIHRPVSNQDYDVKRTVITFEFAKRSVKSSLSVVMLDAVTSRQNIVRGTRLT